MYVLYTKYSNYMKKIITILVVLAILAGGYWWYTQNAGNNQLTAINTFLTNTQASEQSTYTTAQVASHNTTGDCWVVISGKVINATPFINLHPGGPEKIARVCGQDITSSYNRVGEHTQAIANQVIAKLAVGTVTQ